MSHRKIFLDTNVVLDLVLDRKGFVEVAQKIFNLHEQEEIAIYISALTLANVAYIVKKNGKDPFHVTSALIKWVNVIPLHTIHFQRNINSSFKDFEDGLQFFAAEEIPGMEAIVTRDAEGFKASTIPVLEANEFIELFKL